jgi:hypothetical protein
MQAILLSAEEVMKRAYQLYESKIRQKVEIEENIGKMVIIDIETGDYEVDETGLQAADDLYTKHPYARLFGIRIGYNVAASLVGTALLDDRELVIQFTEGGLVTIDEL